MTLTRAWCLRELGDDDAARVALGWFTGDAPGQTPPRNRLVAPTEVSILTTTAGISRGSPPPAGRGCGWRKAVTKMTFGRVNPEPSAKREQTDELIQRICAPLADVHKLAFTPLRRSKTTMTVLVGPLRCAAIAMAVDADADLGDLSARFSERGGPAPTSSISCHRSTPALRGRACAHGDEQRPAGKCLVPRPIRDRHTSLAWRTWGRHADPETHCNVILLGLRHNRSTAIVQQYPQRRHWSGCGGIRRRARCRGALVT